LAKTLAIDHINMLRDQRENEPFSYVAVEVGSEQSVTIIPFPKMMGLSNLDDNNQCNQACHINAATQACLRLLAFQKFLQATDTDFSTKSASMNYLREVNEKAIRSEIDPKCQIAIAANRIFRTYQDNGHFHLVHKWGIPDDVATMLGILASEFEKDTGLQLLQKVNQTKKCSTCFLETSSVLLGTILCLYQMGFGVTYSVAEAFSNRLLPETIDTELDCECNGLKKMTPSRQKTPHTVQSAPLFNGAPEILVSYIQTQNIKNDNYILCLLFLKIK